MSGLSKAFSPRSARNRPRRRRTLSVPPVRLPHFEPLEDRTLLATFFVNSTADAVNPPPGFTTLRSAVVDANALFGDDTINLPAGTYSLSLAGRGDDDAETGDLDIRGNLTICGAGAGTTIINASLLDRVFHVFAGITLDLRDVTVTGGRALTVQGPPPEYKIDFGIGGGILNDGGWLTVNNSTISGNSSESSTGGEWNGGGGIWSTGTVMITNSTISDNSGGGVQGGGGIKQMGGSLTVSNSTFSGNVAIYGFAIWNSGVLSVTDSTFPANRTGTVWGGGGTLYNKGTATITNSTISSGDSAGNAGGIYNYSGTATISNCTMSGNSAGKGDGGAIYNLSTATITNSTISGNSADTYGGGIASYGTLTITDSTITGNSAGGYGGGISKDYSSGTINVGSTIIAGNTGAYGDPDVRSSFISQGHNLIGDLGSATGFTNGVNGDQVGGGGNPVIDPLLGPLQDNGGPTLTHALLPGSPAIDAGDPNFTPPPEFDQRGDGFPRVIDGNYDGTARIDIGAFEAPQPLYEPVKLLNPVGSPDCPRGGLYRITWSGGDGRSRVTMWCLGPKGWRAPALNLPGTDRACDWNTAGASPGWYHFVCEEQRDGQRRLSRCPGWLRLIEPGAAGAGTSMGMGAMEIAPTASCADLGVADGIEEPAGGGHNGNTVAAGLTPIGTVTLLGNAGGPNQDPSEGTGPAEVRPRPVVSEDEGQPLYGVDGVLLGRDGLGSGISNGSGRDEITALTVLPNA